VNPHRLHDPRPGAPGPLVMDPREAARRRLWAMDRMCQTLQQERAGLLAPHEADVLFEDAAAAWAEMTGAT